MKLGRRRALQVMAAGAAASLQARSAKARERKQPPGDAVGMLYDATLCIGCQTCVVACRNANFLDYEGNSFLYDDPIDLSGRTKNVIKLYAEGERRSFVKMQCMHCIDPACVSACMLGAFQKREHGIVTWEGDKCIGCRYCQIACPFLAPRFEWDDPLPRIVKCEMCAHLLAEGKIPACCDVCPRKAVIFGPYGELLDEAHRRLAAWPRRYEPKVYGETDAGGTQVLYLSAAGIPFDALGLPDLGEESVPAFPETLQHSLYHGFIAPVVLFAAFGAAVWRARRTGTPLGGLAPEEEGP